MTREELIQLRKDTLWRLGRMEHEGDYAAGAYDSRENTRALLALIDHLLEKMR